MRRDWFGLDFDDVRSELGEAATEIDQRFEIMQRDYDAELQKLRRRLYALESDVRRLEK